MKVIVSIIDWFIFIANSIGDFLPQLVLRVVLAWEFFESGREKLYGQNWFAEIMDKFPFPFNMVPVDLSWGMATWFELIGAAALLVGFLTRFFSVSLIILTVVAIAAVHWPDQWTTFSDLLKGYTVSDKGFGNYKLPLLYIVMFLPLVFSGPGKLSLDHLIWTKIR